MSVGQRQLVCFARSILTRPAVLLLDEATSSCDYETDDIIQTALRNEFSCTTLIIAHRLNTIMDTDMILVLDDGKVVEYDPPGVLLGDQKVALANCVKVARKVACRFSNGAKNPLMNLNCSSIFLSSPL